MATHRHLLAACQNVHAVAPAKTTKWNFFNVATTVVFKNRFARKVPLSCRVDNPSQLAAYKWDDLVEVHSCLAGEVKTTKCNDKMSENFDPLKLTELRDSFKAPENSSPKPT